MIEEPNAIWKFRGKPTVFGNTVCDGQANCDYTGVVQYDVDTDRWYDLGTLQRSRKYHHMVEVPVSFCEFNDDPLIKEDSAVMIIGGVFPYGNPDASLLLNTPLSSVELFGCPNSEGLSIQVDDFPEAGYLFGK